MTVITILYLFFDIIVVMFTVMTLIIIISLYCYDVCY